jgi:hypothetical protein
MVELDIAPAMVRSKHGGAPSVVAREDEIF